MQFAGSYVLISSSPSSSGRRLAGRLRDGDIGGALRTSSAWTSGTTGIRPDGGSPGTHPWGSGCRPAVPFRRGHSFGSLPAPAIVKARWEGAEHNRMRFPAGVAVASSAARTRLTLVAVALTVPVLASEAAAAGPVATAPISVVAHGAVANDGGNDTEAFRSALAAAAAP